MLILFSLIAMRMTGMVMLNPVFRNNSFPNQAKAALIFSFSLMFYIWVGGTLRAEPNSLLEFGVMLIGELAMGLVLGFAIELAFFTVRYASAIIDFSMGLSMAQIYDPDSQTQITVTSELNYIFMLLLFFAMDGHLRLIEIFFGSAGLVPFGQVFLGPSLYEAVFDLFIQAVTLGLQFAFPLIAMELVTEIAVGIMMRMIPQINVFSVNFQIKIIVGLLMLVFLFSPLADRMSELISNLFDTLEDLVRMMAPAG